MANLPFPKSTIDSGQCIQFAFDMESGRLRTDSTFSGTITVDLDAATDSVSIGDPGTGNTLQINADGSINVNVALSHITDSTRLGDGTNYFSSTTVGSKVGLDVAVTNNVQLFTKQYDTITVLYPTLVTDEYKSRVGGVSGSIQETVTVTYTDATKNDITSVVRT